MQLHWLPTVGSTNSRAMKSVQSGKLSPPAVVLAGRQSNGRGSRKHDWWSAPNCIAVTLVLPSEPANPPQQLSLTVGVAVRTALARFVDDDDCLTLKWPNDLLLCGKKVGGLLCQRARGVDVIGIGINVAVAAPDFPASLRRRAVSLAAATHTSPNQTDVLIAVANAVLHSHCHPPGFSHIRREFDRHHELTNRRVRVTSPPGTAVICGRCRGVDELGRLLVQSGTRLHRIASGHVLGWE